MIRAVVKVLAGFFIISGSLSATEKTSLAKVVEVWSGYSDGMTLFKLSETHINPANCNNNHFYVVDATKADGSNFLSVLLTAQARDANVQVRISLTECKSGYPLALRMSIRS